MEFVGTLYWTTIGIIFPIAFAHLVSLHHILVIVKRYKTLKITFKIYKTLKICYGDLPTVFLNLKIVIVLGIGNHAHLRMQSINVCFFFF